MALLVAGFAGGGTPGHLLMGGGVFRKKLNMSKMCMQIRCVACVVLCYLSGLSGLWQRFLLRAGSRDSDTERTEGGGGGGGGSQQRPSAASTDDLSFECQVPYSEVMRRLVSRWVHSPIG